MKVILAFKKSIKATDPEEGEQSLIYWEENYNHYCKDVRRMSPATISSRVSVNSNFIKFMFEKNVKFPSQITNKLVDEYISWIRNDLKNNANSVRTKVTIVKIFLTYIRDMGAPMSVKLPLIMMGKGEPIKRKAFTREEINQALEYADEEAWLMIRLAFDCAFRISELRSLEINNITGNKIEFIGKGSKPGTVYMKKEVQEKVREWIGTTRPKRWLFECNGFQLTDAQARTKMKAPFEMAGLEGFHPHCLRYSCATEMALMQAPVRKIQLVLRHSSVATTERYICNNDQEAQKAFMEFRGA